MRTIFIVKWSMVSCEEVFQTRYKEGMGVKKLTQWITKPPVDFIFSLLCGAAYFFIVFDFIKTFTHNGGTLLSFFFCPAIICGMALVLLKSVRKWVEEEKTKPLARLIVLHIILFVISIVFLIDALLK